MRFLQRGSLANRRSRASLEDVLVGVSIIDVENLLDVVAAKKWKRVEAFNESVDRRMRKKAKPNDEFPCEVSEECRQSRIAKFIDAAGSNALATSVCTVCAGTFFAWEIRSVLVSYLQEFFFITPLPRSPGSCSDQWNAFTLIPGSLTYRI